MIKGEKRGKKKKERSIPEADERVAKMVAYAGCAGNGNAAEARKAREARVEFGLRQIAVAGALASAAVLAAAGHTTFAGGAAVLGIAVLFARA